MYDGSVHRAGIFLKFIQDAEEGETAIAVLPLRQLMPGFLFKVRKKGWVRSIMTDLEKTKIIEACEANAIPDDEIDYSELPKTTDFSGFTPLSMHDKYYHYCPK